MGREKFETRESDFFWNFSDLNFFALKSKPEKALFSFSNFRNLKNR
jgi:hypothetical protein